MSVKQKDAGSSPPHDQHFFVQAFFRLGETFFANFLISPKSPPLHFFPILQKNGCLKTPKGPPFTLFGTMRLTGDQKNSKKKLNSKIFSVFFLTRVL